MAISSGSIFVFLTLSLAFFCVAFTHALRDLKANDLISEICSKTIINPSYCVQTLRSDPRSRGADLTGLGHIAIDLAQSKARSTANLIRSLEQQAKSSVLRERYSSCLENYEDTIADFDDCRSALNGKDYGGIGSYASAALDGPDTCDDNFSSPPAESPELKQASQNEQELCSAVLVISNKLLGQL